MGTGFFVGLECEHRGKAGARTFALAALFGCLGGLTGDAFALLSLLMLAMFVGFLKLAADPAPPCSSSALPVTEAANGAVLASLTSALVNLPLISRVGAQPRLTRALGHAPGVIAALGLMGAFARDLFVRLNWPNP